MVGRTISHYKILERLGEGGMGVVYKAEDTQLRRTVALKFLPRETLDEVEVKARLIREAQSAASLDHPNICQVFGIHEEGGETFIAMAFIDGPSLAEKIKERPLPLDEALSIAAQIAEGLQEAHEKGIVHRDVKPQNVLLTAKGQVKILDFGLAALSGRSKLTKSGTTLGTPAYMSPEQLEGRDVDRRTDVWALGCVLYEMLTQKTPFAADYEQAIGYGILNEDPEPVSAQRSDVSPEIDRLIGKALAKDPALRYQHADELRADLQALSNQGAPRPRESTGVDASSREQVTSHTNLLPWSIAAALAVALVGVSWVSLSRSPQSEGETEVVRRFSFPVEGIVRNSAKISPDGRYIAYAVEDSGSTSIWLRSLESDSARPLPGTDGAQGVFWSPDSQWLAFGTQRSLRKVPVTGGASQLLSQVNDGVQDGTWSSDGSTIVFTSNYGLYVVSAQGGEPTPLFVTSEEEPRLLAVHPHFLPSSGPSKALVYTSLSGRTGTKIALFDFETDERRELTSGRDPFYSSEGYLVFGTDSLSTDGLLAIRFSLEDYMTVGEVFPVSDGGEAISVSGDGTLCYMDQAPPPSNRLVWRDRQGRIVETVTPPLPYLGRPEISPDGRRVAFESLAIESLEPGNGDVWVHDFSLGTRTQLTFDAALEGNPTWSPSGREIAYWQDDQAGWRILERSSDGTGEPKVLVPAAPGVFAPDWSPDGQHLAYQLLADTYDIRYVTRQPDGMSFEEAVFLDSELFEGIPTFSPNGMFMAYVSVDASGNPNVFVRPFPDASGGLWRISETVGRRPRWSRDGTELFYVSENAVMSVPVSTEGVFEPGRPEELFEADFLATLSQNIPNYDVSLDGQRFLTVEPSNEETEPLSIRLIENWSKEFRDREQ